MPPLNIRGVSCVIAHSDSSPGIARRWTEYGPEADVRFKLAWDDAPRLAAALLGSIEQAEDGSLTRTPPYALPWAPQLYCVGIGEEEPLTPVGQPDGWIKFRESVVPATFGALTWQIEGGDSSGRVDPSGLSYATTKFRVSSEVFQPPNGVYYNAEGKLIDDALIGITRPRVEISIVRHMRARVPLEEAMTLVGCVNADPVAIANREFPRGCLLFTGLGTDPRNDPNGYPTQELDYNFLGNFEVEFNETLTPEGIWSLMNTKADGTGEFPFSYESFDVLFT